MFALKNLYVTIKNGFENATGFHKPCSVKGFLKEITIKTKGSPRLWYEGPRKPRPGGKYLKLA